MRFVPAALVVGLTVAPVAVASPTAKAATTTSFSKRMPVAVPRLRVPGQALLKLASASRADAAVPSTTLKDIAARTGVPLRYVRPSAAGWILVEVGASEAPPDEVETLALVRRLQGDAAVLGASDNKWMRPTAIANDARRAEMWNLDVIGANSAWDVTRGLAQQRIGIIDTGLLRGHEDVGGKAVAGFDFVSDPQAGNDGDGRDPDFQDPGDDCGGGDTFHGTHVAGTIAAATNNGIGVAGINWNAGLVIARALGRCGGTTDDILVGAQWLAGLPVAGAPSLGANRVSVMNLSLGSPGDCGPFEQEAVSQIAAAGVVIVAAAGNDGGPVGSPADCNGVVSVAAHDRNRNLTNYSSFGPEIDIVAPGGSGDVGSGDGVLSTLGPTTATYQFYQGTSMAAPHVAGVISLMQAVNPSLSLSSIEEILRTTGGACGGCGGRASMDAAAAVRAVPAPSTSPPDPVDPVDPGNPPTRDDDNREENDQAGQEAVIGCGARLNLMARARDQDWFAVDAAAGSLTVSISGGSTDLDLYIIRNGTEIVARSDGPTGDEVVNGTLDVDKRIVILVNPFVNTGAGVAAEGPYTLALDCTQAGPPPPEPVEPDPVEPDPSNPDTPGPVPGTPDPDDDIDNSSSPDDSDDPASGVAARGYGGLGAEGGCTQTSSPSTASASAVLALLLWCRRRRR
jgi:serine protease